MDLVLSILAFADGCGPANNRDIWTVFRVVDRLLLSWVCAEKYAFECLVYTKYLMFQCISIYGEVHVVFNDSLFKHTFRI